MTTVDIIKRRIQTRGGEIRYIIAGDRRKLCDCNVEVVIHEEKTEVPTVGTLSHTYKHTYITLVVCDEFENQTVEITRDFMRKVNAYEVSAYLIHEDGTEEKFNFDSLLQSDLDDDRWVFDVTDREMVKRVKAFV